MAQGLDGVSVGELRIGRKGPSSRQLAMIGAAMLVIGGAWSLAFPIVKDIWSSSLVLVTSGITVLALALLHHWLDREGRKAGVAAHRSEERRDGKGGGQPGRSGVSPDH